MERSATRGTQISLLTVLALAAAAELCSAQAYVRIDPFDWTTPTFTVTAKDTNQTAKMGMVSRGLSTASSAFGLETDVVASLPEHSVGDLMTIQADPNLGGVHITSTAGATGQVFFSWDGQDLDPYKVHANDGFVQPIDFTAGGTLDMLTFHVSNQGPDLTVGGVAWKDAENYSEFQFFVPHNADEDVKIPYGDLLVTGYNDWTSVQAFALVVGAGGGAKGPMDFSLWDFGLGKHALPPPPPSGLVGILDQTGGTRGPDVFANNFGSDAVFKQYSSEVATRFVLSSSTQLRSGQIAGDYFQNVPTNPTIYFKVYSDDNGHPSANLVANYTLPLTSRNPYRFNFPDNAAALPANAYWGSLSLNSSPGYDGYFWGSTTLYGTEAYFKNPGGGLGCGSGWTLLSNCETGDKSVMVKLDGETTEQPITDIAVKKVALDTAVVLGDTLRFHITVSNVGDAESTNTRIVDHYYPSLLASALPSQGECQKLEDSPGVLECLLGSLAPGDSATIDVKLIAINPGHWRNKAVLFPDQFSDMNPSNDNSEAEYTVYTILDVEKKAPLREYLANQKIPFTLTVKNVSNETLSDVRLEDVYHNEAFYSVDSGECGGPVAVKDGNEKLTCNVGEMAPGEERSFEVKLAGLYPDGSGINRVLAYTSKGLADKDEAIVRFTSDFAAKMLLFMAQMGPRPAGKRDGRFYEPVDIYLNDVLLADDILPGEGTPFKPTTLTEYPFSLYFAPGGSADRSEAFDSISVDLSSFVTEPPTASLVVTSDSGEAGNRVIVLNDAHDVASNPAHVDLAIVHAASDLGEIGVTLASETEEISVATALKFGQASEYAEITMPGTYSLIVTPTGDPDAAEVFQVVLDLPGEAYLLVFAPDTTLGKLDGVTLYVVDTHGSVVQPAVVTSAESRSGPEQPASFALYDNYPNPFNPSTRIVYDVPSSSEVTIAVYDVSGRKVSILIDGVQPSGTHTVTWNGRSDSGANLASGVYFYRMTAGSFTASRKMVLMK